MSAIQNQLFVILEKSFHESNYFENTFEEKLMFTQIFLTG